MGGWVFRGNAATVPRGFVCLFVWFVGSFGLFFPLMSGKMVSRIVR